MDTADRATEDNRYDLVWRWIDIFRELSMDRLEPYVGELGIDPAHAASWRVVGRQFCGEYYAYADQHAVDDWRAYDGWPIELAEAWLRRALDTATAIEGAAAAASLYAWGEGTNYGSTELGDNAWIWGNVLLYADPRHPYYEPPGQLDPDKLALLQHAYAQLFDLDVSTLTDTPEGQLSEWDTQVCQRYWDWMEDPKHQISPLEGAALTIEYRRLRDLWAVLKQSYSATDFAVLLSWGRHIASGMGIDPEDIQLPPW